MIKLKLDFLKRVLTDTVNNEDIYQNFFINKEFPSEEVMREVLSSHVRYNMIEGLEHPTRGHTMIGIKRLDNVEKLLDQIIEKDIKGDFIETGVWRGGCCIFIAWYLKLHKISRKVFVCDSFEGLPMPQVDKYPQDSGDTHYMNKFLSVSIEEVKKNFIDYNVMSDNISFIKGWFEDTLKDNSEIKDLALLRFDGDMYGSTMEVLNNLYPKISSGGYVIIDDYCLPNCVVAVSDFRKFNQITKEINVVDQCGVYWEI
jgi:O-methyltransferase